MLRLDFDVAVVTGTTDDNWYGVQAKGFGGDKAGLGFSNFQPPFGFASRPLDATIEADGSPTGCTYFKASMGRAGDLAWLGHDARLTDKCPPISKGSSAQWNARGAFLLQDYDEQTSTLYQPIANGTKAHKVTVGVDGNNAPIIDLLHSSGAYLTLADPSVVLRHTGSGYLEIKGDNLTANGKLKVTSGLDVGGGASLSLALDPPLQLYLAALENVISALAAATTPPTTPAVASLLSALAPLRAAIASNLAKAL